jgi:nicotinamide riboside kinase
MESNSVSNSNQRVFKVAVTGPESVGKSTLAMDLARDFGGVYLPEYAREYLESIQRPYTEQDVWHIAQHQIQVIRSLKNEGVSLVFLDTELTVLKIWLENSYSLCPDWFLEAYYHQEIDLYLLPATDIPWQADPLREHPHLRDYFFEKYKKELQDLNRPFEIIGGYGDLRLENAKKAIITRLNQSIASNPIL